MFKQIGNIFSYIEAGDNPLSSSISIIKGNEADWLFDVGNGDFRVSDLKGKYNVIISHFHLDHVGNINSIDINNLYVSKETFRHVGNRGIIVDKDIYMDNLHIFPIPSSHAKGCLAMELDETYLFTGDALGGFSKNGFYTYNAQLLKEEIDLLKKSKSSFVVGGHFKGQLKDKRQVIDELEEIYRKRVKNDPFIRLNEEE